MAGRGRKRTNPVKLVFDTERAIFERQPEESDPQWDSFITYRDMKERSLEKVSKKLGKSRHLMERWSSANDWRTRVEAWDMEVDRRRRRTELDAVEEMRRRQLQLATSVQGLGAMELQKIIVASQQSPNMPILSADQILRLVTEGIKLERINRDQPGEISETRNTVLDPDYVEARIEHLLKARK